MQRESRPTSLDLPSFRIALIHTTALHEARLLETSRPPNKARTGHDGLRFDVDRFGLTFENVQLLPKFDWLFLKLVPKVSEVSNYRVRWSRLYGSVCLLRPSRRIQTLNDPTWNGHIGRLGPIG